MLDVRWYDCQNTEVKKYYYLYLVKFQTQLHRFLWLTLFWHEEIWIRRYWTS